MKKPVRLPLIGWLVPTGVLSLAVLAAIGGVTLKVTNVPLFCVQCHEMDVHYKAWSVSTHKDVECEECHVMPGMVNMAKTKIAAMRQVYKHVKGGTDPYKIKGHVPDASCKKCHQQTREVVVYHGLKITHKKHWDRGIHCTFCHANVVHGPNAATKNTPAMQTCFKCHDGHQAPNNCGTCHETLGVRRPNPFSPEWVSGHRAEAKAGGASCKRCHANDFCSNCHTMATPHPDNWVNVHAADFRKNPEQCAVCHPKATQKIFCGNCHSVRRAHSTDWIARHPDAVRKQPEACNSCHKKAFCSDCHSKYQSHPSNWLSQHPKEANANPARCETCHSESFCVGCHQKKTPESHSGASWLQEHSKHANESDCKTCHKPDFCMSCHKNRKPASHEVNWKKLHPIEAAKDQDSCHTCHSKESCQRCHGMQMPHPSGWASAHRAAAKSNRALCARCHTSEACASCHRGSRPASHSNNWVQAHGSVARRSDASCVNCHTRELCANCHKNTRPASHDTNWLHQHGRAGGNCEACHDKSSCANCHQGGKVGKPASHNKSWAANHGKTAKVDRQGCSMCHTNKMCMDCHKMQMPHPAGWAMGGHRKIAIFQRNSNCWKCHKQSNCAMCHDNQ